MAQINIDNYETYLLNYIDGELSSEESAALLRFLEVHPEYQQELELLQQTKLTPDESVSFPDKTSLYKRPTKPLYIKLWKPAAAAAIILLLLIPLWLRHANKKQQISPIAITNTQAKKIPQPSNKVIAKKPDTQVITPSDVSLQQSHHINKQITHRPAITLRKNIPATPPIAATKINANKVVTLPPIAPLNNKLQDIKIMVSQPPLMAMNASWKKFEGQSMDQHQLDIEKTPATHQKIYTVTISGTSSNPIMAMVGGITHLLASADKYKVTSVQWGK